MSWSTQLIASTQLKRPAVLKPEVRALLGVLQPGDVEDVVVDEAAASVIEGCVYDAARYQCSREQTGIDRALALFMGESSARELNSSEPCRKPNLLISRLASRRMPRRV
jgi:hypothetical protein